MKAILFLLLTTLVLFSCTGEEETCNTAGCDDGYHCIKEKEWCEADCTDEYCATVKETCNKDTGLCEPKPCTETGCKDGFTCDEETLICQPDTSCRVVGCSSELLCNRFNGKCETGDDYPEGPYGVDNGKIIKNIEWTKPDGKKISLKMLHNQFLKTGYPRAIILVASAGWCSPCRQETPRVEEYYKQTKLGDYQKLEVIQTIIEDNSGKPATDAFVNGWITQYSLTYDVVNDTKGELSVYNASGSIPFNMIVDPATMKIRATRNGTDEELSSVKSVVEPLYNQNNPCVRMKCGDNQYCQAISIDRDNDCNGQPCKTGFLCNDSKKCVADPNQEEVVKCYNRN